MRPLRRRATTFRNGPCVLPQCDGARILRAAPARLRTRTAGAAGNGGQAGAPLTFSSPTLSFLPFLPFLPFRPVRPFLPFRALLPLLPSERQLRSISNVDNSSERSRPREGRDCLLGRT